MIKFIKKHVSWIFSGIGITISQAVYQIFKNSQPEVIVASVIVGVTFIAFVVTLVEFISFLKRKDFPNYLKSKVREFFHLLLGDKKIIITSAYKYDCYELNDSHKGCTRVFRDFICENQGLIANYSFTAGELHKKIKDELRKEKPDPHSLEGNCRKLQNMLDTRLHEAIRISFKHMLKYFDGRSEFPPRIIIKAQDEQGHIVDIFRETYEYFNIFPVGSNIGFEHVSKYGRYYFCNDIPKYAMDDDYNNPRLSNRKVRGYMKDIGTRSNADDNGRWIDCWMPNTHTGNNGYVTSVPPSADSCYKSTLIIPMTLLNNERLTDDFRKHFDIPKRSADGVGRAIYALLCFDHRNTGYFIEELDTNAGYVFADILSLYFIDNLKYSTRSNTFKEARKYYT